MAVCASGSFHSLFLDPLGSVWCCGNNEYGKLGLGQSTNTTILIPQKINNLPPIVSVSAAWHSLFVDENGSIWSCGYNDDGRLGLGDGKDRYVPERITNLPKIKSALALA